MAYFSHGYSVIMIKKGPAGAVDSFSFALIGRSLIISLSS